MDSKYYQTILIVGKKYKSNLQYLTCLVNTSFRTWKVSITSSSSTLKKISHSIYMTRQSSKRQLKKDMPIGVMAWWDLFVESERFRRHILEETEHAFFASTRWPMARLFTKYYNVLRGFFFYQIPLVGTARP